jgi:hypothetical protein
MVCHFPITRGLPGPCLVLAFALAWAGCHESRRVEGDPHGTDGGTDAATDGHPTDTAAGDAVHEPPPDGPSDAPDIPWDAEPPPGACPEGWRCITAELPTFGGVDVLVVVDNSKSMVEEQENMARQFPLLIDNLLDPPIDPTTGRRAHVPVTDLHLGVVSTDMGTGGYTIETCTDPVDGDDGVLQHDPSPVASGCSASYPHYLSYDSDAPDPDAARRLGTDFGCIAMLGTDGCGFEQQLEAARRAFKHAAPGGLNDRFLREDTVLMVLWLTDEEDCSVADPAIFDPDDSALGVLNLRCFLHPYMVHPVERYVTALRGLREGSVWPVLLGMIVGVPPGEKHCNGFGDLLGDCLDVPLMQEVVDPTEPTRLRYSCETEMGAALPPRRFVELAQAFGRNAYVHSICQEDYEPALTGLSMMVNSLADASCEGTIVNLTKDPEDGCRCETRCAVVQVLDGDGPCPPGTWTWDHDGDGVPNEVYDGSGRRVTACQVPYAGTGVGACERGCHDPYQTYHPLDEGWFYTLDFVGVACPTVAFTEPYRPPEGASTFVACP